MDRLTYKRCNGIKEGYWSASKKDVLIDRLAEYEDTGLMPEEVKKLNEEQNKYRWSPVTEKLPEEGEMVLVTCRSQKGILSVNRAYYLNNFWHGIGSMSGVTAWMPLPDPYKSKDEHKEELDEQKQSK